MSEEHAHSSIGPLPVNPLPIGPLTFGPADAFRISRLSGSELNDVGRATQRLARQAEARTALLAFRIGESVADDMLIVTSTRPHTHHAADKAAIAEISLQLGISRSQARRYAVLGAQLADLPETSTAFLDGEIRMSRIELVAEALSALDSALRVNAEPLAVELARRTSADSTLRDQLAELVIALDPEAAAEARRDFAERNQNIHIRPEVHGHVSIDGCLPAEQGVHLATRISALVAERLCPDDSRPEGRRRVAAFAEIQGLPGARLTCNCGSMHCPATQPDVEPPDGPEAYESDPAPPSPVEHEPAREGKLDSAEMTVSGDETAASDETSDESAPGAACQTALEVLVDPAGIDVPRLVGYGAIDPAHAAELAAGVIARPVDMPGLTSLIDAAELPMPAATVLPGDGSPANLTSPGLNLAAMASTLAAWGLPDNPAPPIDPSGHGGYPAPPPWALRYRIPEWLREQVVALHGVCRFPECGKSAHHAELDHLVKFHHADPLAGGWTVLFNLIPLCGPDHQRKHLGLWVPTMHSDLSITWTSRRTGDVVTTYPR